MNQKFNWMPNEVAIAEEFKDSLVIEINRRGRKVLYLDVHDWLEKRLGPMDVHGNWFMFFDIERDTILVNIKDHPEVAVLFKLTWA